MAKTVEDTLLVRMEASLRKFEKQMEAGRKAAERSAVGSERAWKKAGDQINANASRATTGLQRLANVSGRGRFVLQNTANQIGDIAVQMQGGTSASRALGQQLPQLLGGFGALGGALGLIGPLMGTVAALGLPVAAALLSASDEGRKLSDILSDMDKALSDMDSTARVGMMTMDELTERYGENAAAVREVYLELVAVNQQRALNSVQEAMLAAGNELSELESKMRSFADARRELLRAQDANADGFAEFLPSEIAALEESVNTSLERLKEEFGLTSAQAYKIVEALNDLQAATGPEAAAEAVRQISLALSQAAQEGAQLDGVFANIAQTAATAYAAFSRVMVQGQAAAAELAEVSTAGTTMLPGVLGPDGNIALPPKSAPKKVTRRGGGSSGGLNRDLLEAQRLVKDVRTEAEVYEQELERIEELHRRFPQVVTSEVRDRAVDALNDAANAAEGMGKRMESSFEGAFTALVSGAMSGREAVQALLADLAKMAAQSAFKSLAGDFFGGGGGGFLSTIFNANGNVFQGGRVTPFANGGVVSSPTHFPMAGRSVGLMGEAGPEAIMPLARVNGKLGVRTQGGGAGGRVTVDVRLTDDLDARIDSRAENVSARVTRRGIEDFNRTVLPRSVQQIQNDPRKVR